MLSATKCIQRMIIYLTLIFVESTLAQVILPGKCPSVSVKPDFDVQQVSYFSFVKILISIPMILYNKYRSKINK